MERLLVNVKNLNVGEEDLGFLRPSLSFELDAASRQKGFELSSERGNLPIAPTDCNGIGWKTLPVVVRNDWWGIERLAPVFNRDILINHSGGDLLRRLGESLEGQEEAQIGGVFDIELGKYVRKNIDVESSRYVRFQNLRRTEGKALDTGQHVILCRRRRRGRWSVE